MNKDNTFAISDMMLIKQRVNYEKYRLEIDLSKYIIGNDCSYDDRKEIDNVLMLLRLKRFKYKINDSTYIICKVNEFNKVNIQTLFNEEVKLGGGVSFNYKPPQEDSSDDNTLVFSIYADLIASCI